MCGEALPRVQPERGHLWWYSMEAAERAVEQRTEPECSQRRTERPSRFLQRGCAALLWVGIAAYVILFTRQSFYLYHHFALTAFDLGIYDQAVWLISRFHSPFVTVRGMNVFADHFVPVVYLLAPLYWIWDSPKAILVAQTVALALGAVPMYALTCRRMSSPPLALLFALAYLCYPAMHWTNTFDFHPDVFATPSVLAAFHFLSCRRWRPYFLAIALVALTKETAGLTITLLGLYALAVDRRTGCITVGLGVLTQLIALGVVRALNDGVPSAYLWLYSQYGSTAGEVAWTLVRHPVAVLSGLVTEQNGRYFFELLQPVLFLPLLAPEVLLLAAPALLSNLLSNRPYMHMIYYQYTVLITPFVIIGALTGFDRLRRWGNAFTTFLLVVYLTASVVTGLRLSPLLSSSWPLTPPVPSSQSREAGRVWRRVPPEASVSAQAGVVPHLSHRHQVYLFPNPFYRVAWGNSTAALKQQMGTDYLPYEPEELARSIGSSSVQFVALQPHAATFPLTYEKYCEVVVAFLGHRAYGIVALGENAILLERGADHSRGLDLLARRCGVQIDSNGGLGRAFRAYAALASNVPQDPR